MRKETEFLQGGGVNIYDSPASVLMGFTGFTALLLALEEAAFSAGSYGPHTLGARTNSV